MILVIWNKICKCDAITDWLVHCYKLISVSLHTVWNDGILNIYDNKRGKIKKKKIYWKVFI